MEDLRGEGKKAMPIYVIAIAAKQYSAEIG
jgi:hypothetical protein